MQVRAYVAALDARQDIAMLRERLPALRTECLRCLEVTTLVRPPTLWALFPAVQPERKVKGKPRTHNEV